MREESDDCDLSHHSHPPACDVGSSIDVQLVWMTWASVIFMVCTVSPGCVGHVMHVIHQKYSMYCTGHLSTWDAYIA